MARSQLDVGTCSCQFFALTFEPTLYKPFRLSSEDSGDVELSRYWNLYSVAPVLAGGWALLGEQDKYVAVSPQRFATARAVGFMAGDDGTSDAMVEAELQPTGGEGLSFTVLGAAAETVSVSVLAPMAADLTEMRTGEQRLVAAMAGKVLVLNVTLGVDGRATVACSNGECVAKTPPDWATMN